MDAVAGAVHLFRRQAYQETGGFRPLKDGGEDTLVELEVRASGWETRTVRELAVTHHGRVTSGNGGELGLRFRRGYLIWRFGYHPLFAWVTIAYRGLKAPFILGGLCQAVGYLWAGIKRPGRVVDRTGNPGEALLRQRPAGQRRGPAGQGRWREEAEVFQGVETDRREQAGFCGSYPPHEGSGPLGCWFLTVHRVPRPLILYPAS